MSDDPEERSVVFAAVVFATTFIFCILVLPFVGFAGGVALTPIGLNWVAASICIPALAFWIGDLQFGHGADARVALNAEGYRWIPLTVWLVVWVCFAWAARGLNDRARVVIAVCVIATVLVGMHVALRVLGVQYMLPNL